MSLKCCVCKSKIAPRTYQLKDKSLRTFNACEKSITHTYSEESLKDIDVTIYEQVLERMGK